MAFARVRTTVLALFFTSLVAAGCAHHTDPVRELNSEIAPFTHSRDQAVELVTTAKHSLGASDLNSLAVSYGALQEKGDAHAAFLVEVISDASFNGDRNAKYASNLTQAIKTFNKSFASVSALTRLVRRCKARGYRLFQTR